MAETRFDKALTDVSKQFPRPEDILRARDLSDPQKLALLRQWDTDLRLQMVASEENMTGTAPGATAELMQSVHRAMLRLGYEADQEKSAPTKTGST